MTAADGGEGGEPLRESFADVPKIENPTDDERLGARLKYPPEVVPDEGPIPDPYYTQRVDHTIDVPLWVVESVAHRLRQQDEPLTTDKVDDIAFEYAQPWTTFTVLDGERTLAEAMVESYGIDVEADDEA